MVEEQSFGELNGHAVGIIMKELVSRAIAAIQERRFIFQSEEKESDYKSDTDFVTDADFRAQEIYVKSLIECFPDFGIVAEEKNLKKEPASGIDAWFTIDPLDGTKAFTRTASSGIGTMVSLVVNGQIAAAYIGDVMTGEIYGFRPGSEKTNRISRPHGAFNLSDKFDKKSPAEKYAVYRGLPSSFSKTLSPLLKPGGFFKDAIVDNGSIGITFTRLWKGEVSGVFLKNFVETPWDLCPVLGISERLGYHFIDIGKSADTFKIDPFTPSKENQKPIGDVAVIREDYIPSLKTALYS